MAVIEKRRAVFLDKDGTLLEDVPYNTDPGLMRLAPGAEVALPSLHADGFRLIVISNQSGVARGYFREDDLLRMEDGLAQLMMRVGAPLSGFYYCPHLPLEDLPPGLNPCSCRKPKPGLILQAAGDHDIDMAESWMVGDIYEDVEAGRRAGCRTVLVTGPTPKVYVYRASDPDFVVSDLEAAARIISREKARKTGIIAENAAVSR